MKQLDKSGLNKIAAPQLGRPSRNFGGVERKIWNYANEDTAGFAPNIVEEL